MIKLFLSDFEYKVTEVDSKLDEALNKITDKMCSDLEHGDEIQLNDTYTLYRHSDEDMWDVFNTAEWEEVASVMWLENCLDITEMDPQNYGGELVSDGIAFDIHDKSLIKEDGNHSRIDLDSFKQNTCKDAVDKITLKMMTTMGYGEEIKLNEKYYLYHYAEDDYIGLRHVDFLYEDIYTVQFGITEDDGERCEYSIELTCEDESIADFLDKAEAAL